MSLEGPDQPVNSNHLSSSPETFIIDISTEYIFQDIGQIGLGKMATKRYFVKKDQTEIFNIEQIEYQDDYQKEIYIKEIDSQQLLLHLKGSTYRLILNDDLLITSTETLDFLIKAIKFGHLFIENDSILRSPLVEILILRT